MLMVPDLSRCPQTETRTISQTERLTGATRRHDSEDTMTGEEQDLSEKYLAHRNVIGDEGDYPDFESWYQAVRYAQGPSAPRTVQEASELRYKDILDAARVFTG